MMKIDDAVALVSIITFVVGIITCLVLGRNKKVKSGFQPNNKTSKEEITKHPPKGGSAQQRK